MVENGLILKKTYHLLTVNFSQFLLIRIVLDKHCTHEWHIWKVILGQLNGSKALHTLHHTSTKQNSNYPKLCLMISSDISVCW